MNRKRPNVEHRNAERRTSKDGAASSKLEVSRDCGIQSSGVADLFSVGQRVYLAIAGYAIGSKVFLPKGARGVVTQADPTGDILTIQFDLASGPVAGLRLPVTHVEKIHHDVQPVRPD